MSRELLRNGWKAVDLQWGVNYRLGLSVPVALLFRVGGFNDLTYVIYPLVMSLLSVVLVFLLGRRLFGSAAGLVAALLVATCPFEAVFGSSMTIDIITSCLTAVTVLAFLKARDAAGARWFAYALLGTAATLIAYMVKEPALYVLPCLGALTLACIRDRRVFVRDVAFYGVVGTAVAATFAADYWATGDVLNRLQVQLPQSGSAVGPLPELLLQYPRWVWRRSPDDRRPDARAGCSGQIADRDKRHAEAAVAGSDDHRDCRQPVDVHQRQARSGARARDESVGAARRQGWW